MLKRNSWWYLAALFVTGVGLLLRLTNLTNPPLDFLAGRQLRSAIIARGMYCQLAPCADDEKRQIAITMWKGEDIYEPQLFERLVSSTYLILGHEYLWIVKVYTALFWLVGAITMLALTSRMGIPEAGLVAVGYYAVHSSTVISGRSFQPEPLMVMWVTLAAYCLYRWSGERNWRWSILAGLTSGIAILVKVVAFFPVIGMLIVLTLQKRELKKTIMNFRFGAAIFLMALIPSAYYFLMIGGRSSGFFKYWTLSFLHLLFEPAFYEGWLKFLNDLFSLVVITLGWIGIIVNLKGTARSLLLGWWGGYVLYVFFLPYQVTTHFYYSLIISPLVALSLGVFAHLLFSHLHLRHVWRGALAGVVLLMVFYPAWITRSLLLSEDARGESIAWQRMGAELPKDGQIVGLTHDYGNRIRYYGWRVITTWPYTWDIDLSQEHGGVAGFPEMFNNYTQGKKYFLVTDYTDLENQPELKRMLYDNYSIFQKGEGYTLFLLESQTQSSP